MRIVIDLQGAQTESRFRGIGRYSLSLAQAIARNRGKHEIIVALSMLFPETIEPIRAAFEGLLPQENIHVWSVPGPTREADAANHLRREVAERIREAFLADLHPDAVLITSLFEGLGDDALTSVGVFDKSIPTAVILYDLIPLISPDIHFRTNKVYQNWYSRKITSLKRSKLLLAISESSKQEALSVLDFDDDDIVNLSGACDDSFQCLNLSEDDKQLVCRKVGISRPFVMYTGGADDRKNLHRLIEAYANLPKKVRQKYQIAFVGKMPEGHVRELFNTAKVHGLANEDIVCTGYVEEDDLVKLYNICTVFIFPSLHEGLGLPPLEAMSCGAPVISSNATSLPEVIGYAEALFDPTSVEAITTKLEQALVDDNFRHRLSKHGILHAKKFSWDESAKRALKALSRFDIGAVADQQSALYFEKTSLFCKQDKRILLLKLDHMGDLLLAVPAITKLKSRYPYATVDIVVGSWNVPLAKELKLFDNIYTLDYFKKTSAEKPSITDNELDECIKQFGRYDIAIDFRRQSDTRFILVKFNSDIRVGYETFDSDIDSKLDIKLTAYPDIPYEKTPLNQTHISVQMLNLIDSLPTNVNDYVYFPELAKRVFTEKINVALFPAAGNDIKQWSEENYIALANLLIDDERVDTVNVYFGSEKEASRYQFLPNRKLCLNCGLDFRTLAKSLSNDSICVANNSFGAHIASYSGCLVIGVYGGHETIAEWAPVFEESYVIHSSANCSPCHKPSKSECANEIICLNDISVKEVFNKVSRAISARIYCKANKLVNLDISSRKSSSQIVEDLIDAIARLDLSGIDEESKALIAENIAHNHRMEISKQQLLVDVSELMQRDAKSGIQRVVRAVLGQLLCNPPEGFVVKPVYAVADETGYRYALKFTNDFSSNPQGLGDDALVEAFPGDIFLGLDLNPTIVQAQKKLLGAWRQRGVKVYFVIYDLLPVLMPNAFPEGSSVSHHRWLNTIACFDGAIAISKAVADEMRNWLQVFGEQRDRPFRIGWFHLGADFESSEPTTGIPESANKMLYTLTNKPTFLMVGTVEPRKGHAQTLAAFEQLWQAGEKLILVIVGKQGWMIETLTEKLRNHPELGKHLFWLESVTDEYLEKIYAACSVLIAASEGEGFGLPLVEAAQHKLPIIARDLPVFREVAGKHAYYFHNDSAPETMVNAISTWLALYNTNSYPSSEALRRITWNESTQQLLRIVIDGGWSDQWLPDGVHRFWGSDPRFSTHVGERRGMLMVSTGNAGHMIYGPYISLAANKYCVSVYGTVESNDLSNSLVDIAIDKGTQILAEARLRFPDNHGRISLLEIIIEENCTDLEVRVKVGVNDIVSISMVSIERSNPLKENTVFNTDRTVLNNTSTQRVIPSELCQTLPQPHLIIKSVQADKCFPPKKQQSNKRKRR